MVDLGSDDTGARPRFIWAFDFGQVMQTLGTIIPIASMVWYMAASNAEMRRDLLALQTSAAIYAPRVDALTKSQDVQDERIGNITDSVRAGQRTSSEILTQIGGLREDMAGLKARFPPIR